MYVLLIIKHARSRRCNGEVRAHYAVRSETKFISLPLIELRHALRSATALRAGTRAIIADITVTGRIKGCHVPIAGPRQQNTVVLQARRDMSTTLKHLRRSQ